MVEPLYKGYSTVANSQIDTALHDMELIKQDLLNHFQTRIGERVGRPEWGSIIHDLLFDLGDDRTEALVVQDAERIIADDPRVDALQINATVSLDTYEITLQILLRAIEFDMDSWFSVTFSQSQV